MANALQYPMACHHSGILYLVGYWGGWQLIRRSADGGQTWLKYRGNRIQNEIDQGRSTRLLWWDQSRIAVWSTHAFFLGSAEEAADF